jgi:hypothetical protein
LQRKQWKGFDSHDHDCDFDNEKEDGADYETQRRNFHK